MAGRKTDGRTKNGWQDEKTDGTKDGKKAMSDEIAEERTKEGGTFEVQ